MWEGAGQHQNPKTLSIINSNNTTVLHTLNLKQRPTTDTLHFFNCSQTYVQICRLSASEPMFNRHLFTALATSHFFGIGIGQVFMTRAEMSRGEHLSPTMAYISWYIELTASTESWCMHSLVTVCIQHVIFSKALQTIFY